MRRVSATVVAGALALLAVPSGPVASASSVEFRLVAGSGSTSVTTVVDRWVTGARALGVPASYSPAGSTVGRREFRQATVDFAVSEVPFGRVDAATGAADPPPARDFAYLPLVARATALAYNLRIEGRPVTSLRLSGETAARIFTGEITRWDDPAIQVDNPALALPDRPVVPVVRSDAAGSTADLTAWLSEEHPSVWDRFCRSRGLEVSGTCGSTTLFPPTPGFRSVAGSSGVAGLVQDAPEGGAITYIENAAAVEAGLPVARLRNASGFYVEPTGPNVTAALAGASVGPDLVARLAGVYRSPDPRAYPLSSYVYGIVPTAEAGVFRRETGPSLASFLRYAVCEGQQDAVSLGRAPLPRTLTEEALAQIGRIPGAGNDVAAVDDCANPTIGPDGADPVLDAAPLPPSCDVVGFAQCLTGTGGLAETPTAPTRVPDPEADALGQSVRVESVEPASASPFSPTTVACRVDSSPFSALGTLEFRADGAPVATVRVTGNGTRTVTTNAVGPAATDVECIFDGTPPFGEASSSPVVVERVPVDPSDGQTGDPATVTGALTITTPFTPENPLDLGAAVLDQTGSAYSASTPVDRVRISDTRDGRVGFALSVSADPFAAGVDSFPGDHAGIEDVRVLQVAGDDLRAGDVATTSIPALAPGIGTPRTVATYPPGGPPGSVDVVAEVTLDGVPTSIAPGAYTSTLTLTAL